MEEESRRADASTMQGVLQRPNQPGHQSVKEQATALLLDLSSS